MINPLHLWSLGFGIQCVVKGSLLKLALSALPPQTGALHISIIKSLLHY